MHVEEWTSRTFQNVGTISQKKQIYGCGLVTLVKDDVVEYCKTSAGRFAAALVSKRVRTEALHNPSVSHQIAWCFKITYVF